MLKHILGCFWFNVLSLLIQAVTRPAFSMAKGKARHYSKRVLRQKPAVALNHFQDFGRCN